MSDLSGFDASQHEAVNFDPLPEGEYILSIVASETKETNDKKGRFLQFEMQVMDGPHKGRKLWDRLNLWNASETAVKIAQGTLAAICKAVGVMKPKDSLELHNIPLKAKIVQRKRKDTGETQNEIKGYSPASTAVAAAPKPDAGAKAPWQK